MSLRVYNRKRKFNETPEPKGKIKKGRGALRFVVQMHDASRLHYDFRLEFGGVYKSWAVPKGPSLNPLDQRLAVFVEDHPIDYGTFEGIIPSGNYGAGTVMVWDRGTYLERGSKGRGDSEAAMKKNFEKGHITFVLDGEKLKGEFALIKLKKDESQKAWLLVKKRDEYSSVKRNDRPDDVSVKTGRTLDEIAEQAEAAGDIWLSHRGSFDREKKEKKKSLVRPFVKRQTKSPSKAPRASSMPRKNKPMLATLSRNGLPDGDFIFDEDYGGLRAISENEGSRVNIYSKSLLPFDKKFPEIVQELKDLDLNAVLDGEIEKKGKSSIYHVFDILFHDGKDLRELPLKERKEILKSAFKETKHIKHTKPASKSSKGQVVAKNAKGVYQSGTTSEWLYIDASAVAGAQKPKSKNKSRVHPLDPNAGPTLTNLDKIYFPDDGYTKGDVIEYYRSIAPYILPYLKDRPESLNRHPNGIKDKGFYQKDVTGHIPKWFKTKRIYSESSDKTIDYAMVQDERSLLYIANLGCIEINPWFSRQQKLDHPDFLVIDLDPDDNPFAQVVEVAHEFHRVLNNLDCDNFVKTSGATGIHIGIPLAAKYDFDAAREFAEKVSKLIQKKFPAITSMERAPAKRRKKIYLDCLQNRRGQTLAAPFCIRPRSGAPVSMPVTWKELTSKLKPEQFNIENAARRISEFDDPWAGVLGQGVNIQKSMKRLKY